MTYSILGRDPATGQVGGAVQSVWYSSGGGGLIWVEAGVGAVATQAIGDRAFGHLGLQMITAGWTPTQVVDALVAGDASPSVRQIGVIDVDSTPAAFTGSDCVPDAEQAISVDCVAQANMMAGPGVPQAMVAAFDTAPGALDERLLAALDAAQAVGGDFRGMQSAGLTVRTGARGTPAWKTAVVNVRVDDDPEPLGELRRLAGLTRAYRFANLSMERLAADDHAGAVDAARQLCAHVVNDPNARMRLGLVLVAAGDPEGAEILSEMARQNDKWLAYVRSLCIFYEIDHESILAAVDPARSTP